MPLFEYRCRSCKTKTEKLTRVNDRMIRTIKCPECGKRAEKIISAVNHKFVGTGWPSHDLRTQGVPFEGPIDDFG